MGANEGRFGLGRLEGGYTRQARGLDPRHEALFYGRSESYSGDLLS